MRGQHGRKNKREKAIFNFHFFCCSTLLKTVLMFESHGYIWYACFDYQRNNSRKSFIKFIILGRYFNVRKGYNYFVATKMSVDSLYLSDFDGNVFEIWDHWIIHWILLGRSNCFLWRLKTSLGMMIVNELHVEKQQQLRYFSVVFNFSIAAP